MAKPQIHGLLSDLHKLLSSYRASDFIEANQYSGISQGMKEVLMALSRESDSEQRTARTGHTAPITGRAHAKNFGPSDTNSRGILDVIRKSQEFESNRAMLAFARSLGLKLDVNSKDSRDRIARRLATLIENMREKKRNDAIARLLAGRSTQTQGWIDVIKSAN